jgi:DNA-binding HxlR family transcriptional regulator
VSARAEEPNGLAAAVEEVGDRWSLQVVDVLLAAPRTFGQLEGAVAGIAASTLSARLKALEASGIVVAVPYSERPLRYGYELSASGRELAGALRLLTSWGVERRGGEPLVRHDVCGTPAEVRWWCPTCEQPADDVTDLHHL